MFYVFPPFDRIKVGQNAYDEAASDKAQAFGAAQSKFNTDAQMYWIVFNFSSGALKFVGEATSTIARK